MVQLGEDGESLISESLSGDFDAQPCLENTALEEQREEH